MKLHYLFTLEILTKSKAREPADASSARAYLGLSQYSSPSVQIPPFACHLLKFKFAPAEYFFFLFFPLFFFLFPFLFPFPFPSFAPFFILLPSFTGNAQNHTVHNKSTNEKIYYIMKMHANYFQNIDR